jgi:2-oxoglutarate ferredoxin oxidoreductase subunit beta
LTGIVKMVLKDDCVTAQIEEVKAQKKYHNFAELLETNDIWEVK